MSGESIDNLINNLSEELKPVKPMMHPILRAFIWLGISVLYIVAVTLYAGMRHDMDNMMYDSKFLFETILMSALAISSAIAAALLCIPDMRGQRWVLAVPISLIATFGVWVCTRAVSEDMGFTGMDWMHCYEDSMLLGSIPALFILFMSLKGKTTRPFMMITMNALAVASIGYIGMRITCVNDMLGHVLVYHTLPFITFGIILAVIARRIYKW